MKEIFILGLIIGLQFCPMVTTVGNGTDLVRSKRFAPAIPLLPPAASWLWGVGATALGIGAGAALSQNNRPTYCYSTGYGGCTGKCEGGYFCTNISKRYYGTEVGDCKCVPNNYFD